MSTTHCGLSAAQYTNPVILRILNTSPGNNAYDIKLLVFSLLDRIIVAGKVKPGGQPGTDGSAAE